MRNQQIFDANQEAAVASKPNAESAIVPLDPNIDTASNQQAPSFDLLDLINSVMNDEEKNPQPSQSTAIPTTSTTNNINNVPRSMFANCTIGNVIFKIDK